MADLENRVDKLEERVNTIDRQLSNLATKLDLFITTTQQNQERQDAEMRALREKQDAEMRALREKQDADFQKLSDKIDGYTRNMTIAVIVGVGAMVLSVLLK